MLLYSSRIYHNEDDPCGTTAHIWHSVVHGSLFFQNDVEQILIALVPTWSYVNVYHTLTGVRAGHIDHCDYPITINEETKQATINGFTFTFDELLAVPSIVVDREPKFESYITVMAMETNIQLTFKIDIPEKHFMYSKEELEKLITPMRWDVEENPIVTLKSIDTDLALSSWITEKSIILEIGNDCYQLAGWIHEDIKNVTSRINWKDRANLQIKALCSRPHNSYRPMKRLSFKHDFDTTDGTTK